MAAGQEKQPGRAGDQQADKKAQRPEIVLPGHREDRRHRIIGERRALVDRVAVEHAAIKEAACDRRVDRLVQVPQAEAEGRPTQPEHATDQGERHKDLTPRTAAFHGAAQAVGPGEGEEVMVGGTVGTGCLRWRGEGQAASWPGRAGGPFPA